jgi:hypothetical protein
MTLNDRVLVLECHDHPRLRGKTGIVINNWPLVEFDEDVSGPKRCHGESGRQWYFNPCCLQRLLDDGDDVRDEAVHARIRAQYVGRFWKVISDPPTEAAREAIKLLYAGILTDGQLKAVVEDMEASMFKLG